MGIEGGMCPDWTGRNFAWQILVRLWGQPKSSRPHAPGLDFGPRSTHAKKRGSRIVRKCRGRADFGRRRDFFDPRNFAWVEQNLAPARFGPTLGPGPFWGQKWVTKKVVL